MSEVRVPFLMYHAIQGPAGSAALAEVDPLYTITLADFEQQMAYLRRTGFQTISLAQFLAWHHNGESLPPKPIILTFDDGHPSHFELVLPRLTQYQFKGVFAVVSSWIGTPRSFSVDQLRTLQAAGMEIISHGMSHLPLSDLPIPALKQELTTSRTQLEGWLGKPIQVLAIPRGYVSVRVRQTAFEAGYQVVCTSRPDYNGLESDVYNLARLPIKAHLEISEFTALVEAHPARRFLELSGYIIRRGAQKLLGPKRYDRLRAFLLGVPNKGSSPNG